MFGVFDSECTSSDHAQFSLSYLVLKLASSTAALLELNSNAI